MRVVGTVPESGDGSVVTADVPVNRAVRVRFDRFLRTDTAVRQSIVVFGGTPNADGTLPAAAFLEPTYDPIERTLTVRPNGDLAPNTLYTVRISKPTDEDESGIRAWDGAPIDRAYQFQFKTGSTRDAKEVGEPSTACAVCVPNGNRKDPGSVVDSGLQTVVGACGSCHAGSLAPMALDMGDFASMQRTALGRPAHQTLSGPSSATGEQNPGVFGSSMPVFSAGQPGNSYALYKMLAQSDWFTDETDVVNRRFAPPVEHRPAGGYAGDALIHPTEELDRLRAAFVRGVEMPPGGFQLGPMRLVSRWLAEGAPDQPSTCPTLTEHCACDSTLTPTVTTDCMTPTVLGYTFAKPDGVVAVKGCACTSPDCGLLFESAVATRRACLAACNVATPKGTGTPSTVTPVDHTAGPPTCNNNEKGKKVGSAWDKKANKCLDLYVCGDCKSGCDDLPQDCVVLEGACSDKAGAGG